jgi:hypothetical protein
MPSIPARSSGIPPATYHPLVFSSAAVVLPQAHEIDKLIQQYGLTIYFHSKSFTYGSPECADTASVGMGAGGERMGL